MAARTKRPELEEDARRDLAARKRRVEDRLSRIRAAFAALPPDAGRNTRLVLAASVVEIRDLLHALRADVKGRLLARRRHAQPQKAYAQAARLAPAPRRDGDRT
ncbi:MAG: hypothetical protein K9H25_09770 [Rhodospirillum sp.]|nr:hypothetical protein [Rhodospirillum sp.]MCF8491690.1 hypothetical protein [Rhodospirillum sp.]MCF8501079.1 hypothetical protein [Rhodospirillum sp.]